MVRAPSGYTAFWRLSGAYAVTVFSFASSLYCTTGTDFAVLCCRCSICCCCCCNNLFLGCYMATRPRCASCRRLWSCALVAWIASGWDGHGVMPTPPRCYFNTSHMWMTDFTAVSGSNTIRSGPCLTVIEYGEQQGISLAHCRTTTLQ